MEGVGLYCSQNAQKETRTPSCVSYRRGRGWKPIRVTISPRKTELTEHGGGGRVSWFPFRGPAFFFVHATPSACHKFATAQRETKRKKARDALCLASRDPPITLTNQSQPPGAFLPDRFPPFRGNTPGVKVIVSAGCSRLLPFARPFFPLNSDPKPPFVGLLPLPVFGPLFSVAWRSLETRSDFYAANDHPAVVVIIVR